MKKTMDYFWPFVFALFSFCTYILLYCPRVGSEDFVTALLVFFAALGWSAVILLTKEKKQTVYYIYISAVVIFPVLIVLFFKKADPLWHPVTIGLILGALVGLRLFVSANYKRK